MSLGLAKGVGYDAQDELDAAIGECAKAEVACARFLTAVNRVIIGRGELRGFKWRWTEDLYGYELGPNWDLVLQERKSGTNPQFLIVTVQRRSVRHNGRLEKIARSRL